MNFTMERVIPFPSSDITDVEKALKVSTKMAKNRDIKIDQVRTFIDQVRTKADQVRTFVPCKVRSQREYENCYILIHYKMYIEQVLPFQSNLFWVRKRGDI